MLTNVFILALFLVGIWLGCLAMARRERKW